jgi:hypothetical protein
LIVKDENNQPNVSTRIKIVETNQNVNCTYLVAKKRAGHHKSTTRSQILVGLHIARSGLFYPITELSNIAQTVLDDQIWNLNSLRCRLN